MQKNPTGEYISKLVSERLERFDLSKNDLAAATTDAGGNVLRAVHLLGVRKQKCFAHGLDLVMRKAVYGKKARAFDVEILNEAEVSDDDEDDYRDEDITDDEATEAEADAIESDGEQEEAHPVHPPVTLGPAIQNLRDVARYFKRRPHLMDEIRRTTAREEYNGKELRPKLDCETRWYSTLVMIERALRILPALNNVLSRYGTPISARDSEALERIAAILAPFKRAILFLCKAEANLSHADKVFTVLLEDLGKSETELAGILAENLKAEIRKRRTILSTLLAILEDPTYDFKLETTIGQRRPSDDELLEIIAEIVNAKSTSDSFDSEDDTAPSVRFSFVVYFFLLVLIVLFTEKIFEPFFAGNSYLGVHILDFGNSAQ